MREEAAPAELPQDRQKQGPGEKGGQGPGSSRLRSLGCKTPADGTPGSSARVSPLFGLTLWLYTGSAGPASAELSLLGWK